MNNETPSLAEQLVKRIVSTPEESGETGGWCLPIRDNNQVTGNQISQFKYDTSTDGPYQELTKNANREILGNKYLVKISMAMNTGPSHLSKVGLGLSAASLGVGIANLHNSTITARANKDKVSLEHKSLGALNKINNTLSTAQLHPSKLGNNQPLKKI